MNNSFKRFLKYSFSFLLYFYLTIFHVEAQDTLSFKSYAFSYVHDTKSLLQAPKHWDNHDLLLFNGFIAVAGGLFYFDEPIHSYFTDHENSGVDKVIRYGIRDFGGVTFQLPLLGALYLNGVIGKNDYDKSMALLGLKVFAINGAVTRIPKMTLQRHRPYVDHPADAYSFKGPFGFDSDFSSFVSGHSSTAFSMAVILSDGYGKQHKWIPYVAYSLASMASFSRVYQGKHWASDVFCGATLGFVTGKLLFKINKRYLPRH